MLVGGVSNLRAACPASWIYLDILLFHSGYLYRELSGVGARRYCQSEFHTWCGSQFSITRRRQDVCPLCYFFNYLFLQHFATNFLWFTLPLPIPLPWRHTGAKKMCHSFVHVAGEVRKSPQQKVVLSDHLPIAFTVQWVALKNLVNLGFDLQNASSYDINRFVIPSYLSYLSPEKKIPKFDWFFSHEPMMWDDCDFIRAIWDTPLM